MIVLGKIANPEVAIGSSWLNGSWLGSIRWVGLVGGSLYFSKSLEGFFHNFHFMRCWHHWVDNRVSRIPSYFTPTHTIENPTPYAQGLKCKFPETISLYKAIVDHSMQTSFLLFWPFSSFPLYRCSRGTSKTSINLGQHLRVDPTTSTIPFASFLSLSLALGEVLSLSL